MNRRDFIGGIGSLLSVSSLPIWADDSSVFTKRGIFERLSLAYRHIKVGASEPFSILHISDTHLTAAYEREGADKMAAAKRRTQTFGGRQEEALRDSLAWAKEHVDYVLHTGDLIDFQSEANFDLVHRYYGDSIFGPMGNHEFYTYLPGEKHTWQEPFKNRSWSLLKENFPNDARFFSKVINGVNFVCLDDVFGTIQPDQEELFRAEAKKGLPIILCMHVPFYSEKLWMLSRRFWTSQAKKFRSAEVPSAARDWKRQLDDVVTSRFITYLKSEPLLKGILVGHEHITMDDVFSPTARQYVVGGNFMFHGQEVLFS